MKKLLLLSILLTIHFSILPSEVDNFLFSTRESFSLSQQESGIIIDIFPNPVTDGRITVRANQQILSIQVMNITGKMVFNQQYSPGNFTATVELNNLEHGLYLVRATFDKNTALTEKVMIK